MTMTKRQRESLKRQIDRYMTKIAKKRDEIRKLTNDIEGVVESVGRAEDGIEDALADMRRAKDNIDRAADSLSEYV